ncbi:hypothetical protein V495_08356 [Pseudogymnoascus sp. VKM F-4514 (FW-929)]|nr:hypothetical protein V495_08356 [Pseudogymnoascus sp. VKM F-4514 (FW-929)]KFY67493.1 hypothetical protein V497_00365 [Pseudogymnoascus sp. VKM F-4516 (FW-969)]
MADLASEKVFDALALSKVAQQLLHIQTQQATHVADLEAQIATLSAEIKLKAAAVKARDVQIASLQLELDKLKLDQAQKPRRPWVVRLPPAVIPGPPQSPSLPGSLATSQSAHIRTKSASDIFTDKSNPTNAPRPLSEGVTTKAGALGGSRTPRESRTGQSSAAALRFQDFPFEIQRKIWRYSMPAPQVLELCHVPEQLSLRTPSGNASATLRKYVLIGDLPAAFHTYQRSRVEILRVYGRLLARKETAQGDVALVKRQDSIDSYADLRRDTVYIGVVEGRTTDELYWDLAFWPVFRDVQYLAVDMEVWKSLVERHNTLYDLILRVKSLKEVAIVVGEERSVPQAKLGKPMLLVDCQDGDHEEERRGMEKMIREILLGSLVNPPKIRICTLKRRPAASAIRDPAPTSTSPPTTPNLAPKPDDATGSPVTESKTSDDQPAVPSTRGSSNFDFTLRDPQFGAPLFGPPSPSSPSFTPHSGVTGTRRFVFTSSRDRKTYISDSDGDQFPQFAPVPHPGAFSFLFGQPKKE